jgi:hypothetical protein
MVQSDGAKPIATTARKKRALLLLFAGVAVLAAVFFVAKVVMPHSAPSNPVAPILSAPAKAQAVANAANAATSNQNAAGSTVPGQPGTTVAPSRTGTATTTTSVATGPQPNLTRNPFLP